MSLDTLLSVQNTLWISSLPLVVSLTAALRNRPPDNIARYLWVVLTEVPFLWVTAWRFGDESWVYAVVYVAFTALVLGCIASITLDALRGRPYFLRPVVIAFVLAASFAKLARMDMHGQWAWISLSEGFLLLWGGILTAYAGAYRQGWQLVYVPLGIFWCLQAGFSLGWAIHGEAWQSLNWVLPPLMASLMFWYLAFVLKSAPQPR